MATSIPETSNPATLASEAQWLFTEEELQMTPTIEDGWTVDQERECRAKGVNFISSVGIMLRIPQLTLATASVFLHRFYCRHSMEEKKGGYHYYSMAATALFLATKVEENCRKVKELVIACCRIAQKNPNLNVDDQSKEYWRWRDTLLIHEDILLEAICFDMTVRAPHSIFFEMLIALGEQENKRVRNAAWAFCNDSLLTVNCLMFTPHTIAGASIYFAAKVSDYTLPEIDGLKWWQVVKCNWNEMKRVVNFMADFYEQFPNRKQTKNEYHSTPLSDSPAPDESLLTPARTSNDTDRSQTRDDFGSAPTDSAKARDGSPVAETRTSRKRPADGDDRASSAEPGARSVEVRSRPAAGNGDKNLENHNSTNDIDEGRERKRQRTVEANDSPAGKNGARENSADHGSEDGEVT